MLKLFVVTVATIPVELYKMSSNALTSDRRSLDARRHREQSRTIVQCVAEPVPTLDSADRSLLTALLPVVEFLGGSLVAEPGPGDLPVERAGKILAHVRSPELHGALDRMVQAVERDADASLTDMDREQKQMAVRALDEQGVFLLRGAVDQVAKSMGVSRVTLYSYLNALETRP
jgi:hypothetical protein